MKALESRLTGAAMLWLAAFAAIVAIIGWETDWGRSLRPEPQSSERPAPQPVAVALLPEYRIDAGPASRSEMVDRPAFVPTRRPAPAPAQEVARTQMQRGQFTLTGTAVVDKGSIAFLREASGGRARTVRAGDTINGVTVADVRADRVKLVMGDESEELVLKVASGPRTTIQPPQPGAPGAPGPQSPAGAVPPGAPVPPGQARPAVPAGAPPGAAQQQVGALPTMQPSQSGLTEAEAQLLERRRAARAAQAAAAAAGGAAPATNSPATPGAADPAWAEVYRRMQQPRR